MDIYGIVYLVRNQVNGKVYVGQTVQATRLRWNQHKCRSRKGCKYHFHNAIRKHGEENFSVVELGYAYSKEQLDDMEKREIRMHDSTDKHIGYNSDLGGNTVGKMSESTKAKIGAANKVSLRGRTPSEETRKKVSVALTGKPWSKARRAAHAA